ERVAGVHTERTDFMPAAETHNPEPEVHGPEDFTMRNAYPLSEQVRILKTLTFPESVPDSLQFCLAAEDYAFLYRELSRLPRQAGSVDDASGLFHGLFAKLFIYGNHHEPISPHIRIINKAGWGEATMTDCAYIVDFEKDVEFIL